MERRGVEELLDTAIYTTNIDNRVEARQQIINQHTTLVEQRDRCVEALKGVAIMLNTELERYEQEPWAQRVRAALATVEQGHEEQAGGGRDD